jgi:hypothetical protein
MESDNLMKMYMGGEDSRNKFDDPFMLPSSDYIPGDLKSALDFCMFLYYLNPQFRKASQRVARHFITDFEFPGEGSAEEKDTHDEYLTHNLRLPQALAEMGDEWACYGNAFFRIHFPFDRVLIDDRRDKLVEYSLDMFGDRAEFDIKEFKYEIPDPTNSKKKIKLSFRDIPSKDKGRIRLRKLDPRDVTIRHNFISGTNSYIWDFPKEVRSDCKAGKLFIVNEIPLLMLKAIADDEDFLFNEDEMFHFKAPTVSGVSNKGWGIPETLANYRSLHQIQVYRKIDEAIGLDYMVPFRIFTPEPGSSETSVVRNLVLSQWKTQVQNIIENRRKDKFAMHAFPFPLKYQEFGADGKNLAPKDLVEYQTNNMLDAMGYPAELFKGSLAVQQVPTAVRLFENSFMFIYLGFTDFCQWVSRRVARYMEEPFIDVRLQKPSLADNMDRQNVIMQLSSAGEISRKKAYAWLGITDAVDEKKERLEEDSEVQKIQIQQEEELRREMESGTINQQLDQQAAAQQQQGGGGGTPPGGPPQGGAQQQGSVSPMDVQGQAQELAQQWLGLPEGERKKAMAQVKATDTNLHALAKQFMEDMRSQAGSDGVQQMYQQVQGGGQG